MERADSAVMWSLSAITECDDDSLFEFTSKDSVQSTSSHSTKDVSDATLQRLLEENIKLLGKVKTGTATRLDRAKIAEIAREIKDVTMTKTEMRKMEQIDREEKIQFLKTKVRQQELKDLHQLFVDAEQVDLAFMCDSTGSMATHLNGVVNQIFAIVDSIKTTNPRLRLRIAFLGYRDISDGNRFEISDFQPSIDAFKNFVKAVTATGGADGPEDIAGALQQAVRLSWSQTSRVLFHIADAPCHGTMYHSLSDDYPAGDPSGLDIMHMVRGIKEMDIAYYFGKINDSTNQMISMINQRFHGYIQDVNIADTAKLTVAVSGSVAKTVMTKTTSMLSRKGKMSKGVTFGPLLDSKCDGITLVPHVPNWATLREKVAVAYTHAAIKNTKDLQKVLKVTRASPTDGTDANEMKCKIALHPFQKGESRVVYYGQVYTCTGWTERLFKEFKETGYKYDLKHYLQQIENSTVARYLASNYNKIKPKHCMPIEFYSSHVFEIIADRKYYCVERKLSGSFIKYSNNTGFWDMDQFDESLARFCIWSHKVTDGYIMVSDLQGIKTPSSFTLTDPVILCKDVDRFGCTNLGPKFMEDVKISAERALRIKGICF